MYGVQISQYAKLIIARIFLYARCFPPLSGSAPESPGKNCLCVYSLPWKGRLQREQDLLMGKDCLGRKKVKVHKDNWGGYV